MDKKISELDAAAALTGTEVAPLVQSGGNVKATIQQITTAVTGATGTNGETVTTDKPRLNLTQTWNAVGTTFTGLKFNVTNTASDVASSLIDLQIGGTSRFKIDQFGIAKVFVNAGFTNEGIEIGATNSSAQTKLTFKDGLFLSGAGAFDVIIRGDGAADILAQRRTTNAQTFRIYNTFTDASNYERGFVRWDSNRLEVGTEKAGTGTARTCRFGNIAEGEFFESVPDGTPSIYSGGSRFYFGTYYLGIGTATGAPQHGIALTAGGESLRVVGSTTAAGGTLEFIEMTAPVAPAANGVRIYAEDDGAGKTRLMALFATGAAQQIAIEP